MIAIEGMSMPSCCMNCRLLGKEVMYCSIYPRKDLDVITVATTRPDWCPLIEIEERKKGKWIETAEEYYKAINEKGGGVDENTPYFDDDIACPNCLSKFSVIDNETERFKCCPNCGAEMR